jgi:uncharacterized protein YqeY
MSIKEQLMADMKEAMKARENGRLALKVIRMARADIRQAEIDSGHADFNDDQVLEVLRKEMKQYKETLEEIRSSGRQDLIDGIHDEMTVLQKYLPAEMSEEEIRTAVQETVNELDPEKRSLGNVMKAVMPRLKGRADGKAVNRIVREFLS